MVLPWQDLTCGIFYCDVSSSFTSRTQVNWNYFCTCNRFPLFMYSKCANLRVWHSPDPGWLRSYLLSTNDGHLMATLFAYSWVRVLDNVIWHQSFWLISNAMVLDPFSLVWVPSKRLKRGGGIKKYGLAQLVSPTRRLSPVRMISSISGGVHLGTLWFIFFYFRCAFSWTYNKYITQYWYPPARASKMAYIDTHIYPSDQNDNAAILSN